MKKIVLNISEVEYEKFKFEAILERKSIQQLIRERIFFKPFCEEVDQAYDEWATEQLETLLKEES